MSNRPCRKTFQVRWLRVDQYYRNPFGDPDCRSIAEAIRVLEHADLVMRLTSNVKSPEIGLTRRRLHAQGTNTERQHLGLSDAPPTG